MGTIFERMLHHLVVGSFHDNLSCAKGKIPKADEIFLMALWVCSVSYFRCIWSDGHYTFLRRFP